jgi:hypothetical protein
MNGHITHFYFSSIGGFPKLFCIEVVIFIDWLEYKAALIECLDQLNQLLLEPYVHTGFKGPLYPEIVAQSFPIGFAHRYNGYG